MICAVCQKPTTAADSRRAWVKEQTRDARVCATCLEKRGQNPPPPRCANGSLWPCGPCKKCQADTERDCRDFQRDRFFGKYDAQGFMPAERAALKGRRT